MAAEQPSELPAPIRTTDPRTSMLNPGIVVPDDMSANLEVSSPPGSSAASASSADSILAQPRSQESAQGLAAALATVSIRERSRRRLVAGCYWLLMLMCGCLIVMPLYAETFEYKTINFIAADFNYTYQHGDGHKHVASLQDVAFFQGKWGSLNPGSMRSAAGHLYSASAGWTGCPDDPGSAPSTPIEPESQPVILLVKEGGDCTLWEKVVHAASFNATGLVEYSSDPKKSSRFLVDYEGDEDVEPSGVIYALAPHRTGVFFEELVLNGSHVHFYMSEGRQTIMHVANKTHVIFVVFSFTIVTVVCLMWLVFYHVQGYREMHAANRNQKKIKKASKKALSMLKVRTLKKDDKDIAVRSCSVCLEDFSLGDVVRDLTCSHMFHKVCIDPWLLAHQNCPNCKTNILRALNLDGDLTLPVDTPPEEQSRLSSISESTGVTSVRSSQSSQSSSVYTLPVTANLSNTSDLLHIQSFTVQTAGGFVGVQIGEAEGGGGGGSPPGTVIAYSAPATCLPGHVCQGHTIQQTTNNIFLGFPQAAQRRDSRQQSQSAGADPATS